MSVILQNSFSSSNLFHNVDKGNSGSLAAAVAAWQSQLRWQRCGGSGSGSGGSLVVTRRQRRQQGGSNSVAVAAVWRQQCGSMVAEVAAQWRWWRQQCCVAAAWQHDGSNMRMMCYKVFVVEVQNMYLWNMMHMIVS
jgi:hypothetical protein